MYVYVLLIGVLQHMQDGICTSMCGAYSFVLFEALFFLSEVVFFSLQYIYCSFYFFSVLFAKDTRFVSPTQCQTIQWINTW